MIILENVSKYYPTKFGRNYVLRDVSITLPRDRNIGILGVNGAGKIYSVASAGRDGYAQ